MSNQVISASKLQRLVLPNLTSNFIDCFRVALQYSFERGFRHRVDWDHGRARWTVRQCAVESGRLVSTHEEAALRHVVLRKIRLGHAIHHPSHQMRAPILNKYW